MSGYEPSKIVSSLEENYVIPKETFRTAYSGLLNGEEFNMFYISPYFTSSLAVFSDIHKALGWVPLMISYIAACFLAVSLIFVVNKYLKKWCLSRTLNRA